MKSKEYLKGLIVSACLVLSTIVAYSETPAELFQKGVALADEGAKEENLGKYSDGVALMEKAGNKEKRADWCFEIGSHYYYPRSLNGHYLSLDRDKGHKWFDKAAKLGHIKSALILFRDYKPEKPYSILSPKSEWKQYFKERDKCYKYAGIALNGQIPSDFNDYTLLSDAAYFTNNENLANKYIAIAADNGEYGAINVLIKDERALDHLTSPKAMFDAATKMWQRGSNDYGHNDAANGLKWFERSAKEGYGPAQNQMGYLYLTGQVVIPDTLKAVTWYKLAAKNQNPNALRTLGRMYLKGIGVEKDTIQALQQFSKGVEIGDSECEMIMGYCNLYGIGIDKNPSQARIHFQSGFDKRKSSENQRLIIYDNGIIDLDYLLGLTYYAESSPEAIPHFEASLKYTRFDNKQRADLLYKLSSCYRDGKCGVHIDIAKANSLLEEAKKYSASEILMNSGKATGF